MAQIQLSLLGTFKLTIDGALVSRFRSQREAALLAYLAVEADQAHARERLAGLLWPDKPEATARQNLRQTLTNLRTLLHDDQRQPPLLLTERNTVQWNRHSSNTLDVATFRTALAECAAHKHSHLAACTDCQSRLAAAVTLYHGPFLDNFVFGDSDLYEEWLLLTRERLQQQAQQTLGQLCDVALVQGDWAKLEQFARRHVAIDPFHEPAQRHLIQALVSKGDRGGALSHFETFAAYLQRELGVAPSPETLALITQIRRRESLGPMPQRLIGDAPATAEPQHPETGPNVYKLAEVKLTDAPLIALAPAQLAPASHTAPHPLALPIAPLPIHDWDGMATNSRLVGRTAEIAQLQGWLHSGARVICLWGWAGVGKSALAQTVAHSQTDHAPVIIWRSLLNVPPLAALVRDWLAVLGVPARVGAPNAIDETLDQQLQQLFEQLRRQRTLLVLDNLDMLLARGLAGRFRPEHTAYAHFFQRFAQSTHQGTLLLTCREQPELFVRLEEEIPTLRSLAVAGLSAAAGQQLLAANGLPLPAAEGAKVVERFTGNPDLLKFAVTAIHDLFAGDVGAFLAEEMLIYGRIRELFEQYVARMTYIEGAILNCLVIAGEPVPLARLRATLVPPTAPEMAEAAARYSANGLVEAIHSLLRRDLIEQTPTGFTTAATVIQTVQSVLLELLTQEVRAGTLGPKLYEVALVDPQASAAQRQQQLTVLVRPLVARLAPHFQPAGLVHRLEQMAAAVRQTPPATRNYLLENLTTLLDYVRPGQTMMAQQADATTPVLPPSETLALAEQAQGLAATSAIPAFLPEHLTPLVGRERELAELMERLHQPTVRLLTLVGAGGMGKTTLALAVAQTILDFRFTILDSAASSSLNPKSPTAVGIIQNPKYTDGIFFVALAPLTSAAALPSAIAMTLELTLQGSDLRQALLQQLRHKHLLLILDNVEHLLHEDPPNAGGNASGIGLISEILQAAPGVQMLATSRERLNLRGEHLYAVQPLAFSERATLAEAATAPAVRLFVQSAQRSNEGFMLTNAELPFVLRICQLVQGMPLGLELAAANVDLLPLAEIASEIERSAEFLAVEWRDVPARQRSMRAVFAWSWQLLNELEQRTLRQLAIFRGGFTRAAAQQVTGANLPMLLSLMRKSLLQRVETGDTDERFQLHELLRQFAAEQLGGDAQAEQQIRAQHATYYLGWLAAQPVDFAGSRYQATLHAVETELGNLQMAWTWAIEEHALPLLAAAIPKLSAYYQRRGRYQEGYTTCERLIGQLDPAPVEESAIFVLGQALAHQGAFATQLKRPGEARTLLEGSLRLLNRPQFEAACAFLYYSLGYTAYLQGQLAEARGWLERSLTLYQRHGEQPGAAFVLYRLGSITWLVGEYVQSHRWYGESLALYRTLEDRMGSIQAMSAHAILTVLIGQEQEAERLFAEVNALIETLDDPLERGGARRHLGWLLTQVGRNQAAQAQYEACLTLTATAAEHHLRLESYLMLGYIHLVQQHYDQALTFGQALFDAASALGIGRDAAFALMLRGLAELGRGAYGNAYTLLQRALVVDQEIRTLDDQSYVLFGLSYVQRALGDRRSARQTAVAALQDTAQSRSTRAMRLALGGYVGVLLDEGAIERAIELATLFMHHPYHGNSPFYRDLVSQPVLRQAAQLPPEVVAAAQARGRARDLIATIEELWAETTARQG